MNFKLFIKQNLWSVLLVASLFLEILLLSKFKNIFGVYISPFVILINNFVLVFLSFKIKKNNNNLVSSKISKNIYLYSIFVVSALVIGFLLNQIFINTPISASMSDIIPTLQKYNTRLLSGEFPYLPIQYDGWTVVPNYLPMQWLPFLIAEVLNFDYRWIAYIAFVVINFFYWKQGINKNSFYENIFKILLPFIFVFFLMKKGLGIYGSNVELLLVAYYMFLAFTIKSKNPVLIGIAVLFCSFSRFSLIFWLPLYAFLLFQRENFKFIFKVGITVFVGFLLIYAIPFLSQDPYIFFKGLKYYGSAAVGEWKIKSFQQQGDIPFHLGHGVGFAVYFYKFGVNTLEQNLNLTKMFHVIISLTTVIISFLVLHFKKLKIESSFLILLSFKIYLSVFYAFIHIPYIYLQQVPLFMSIAILYELKLFKQSKS